MSDISDEVNRVIDRTAEMTAHMVTQCLLRSFTLEEAIAAVEEASQHVGEAGGEEATEREQEGDPYALEIINVTAAIVRGIRRGHKDNLERDAYGK